MSEFLAAVLSRAAIMVLEALLVRLFQALLTSTFRMPMPQAA
ncbi:hypothetical protein OHB01_30740 [Microbispora hainanensis]|uniref:Uncharacterized protein n=1 Tax=Microbispora hainanensis TaxID=568844 RepID=A0ABZ1SUG9_9ACTN|nr:MULTISPECIES: hypothetical protein [Microbispora]